MTTDGFLLVDNNDNSYKRLRFETIVWARPINNVMQWTFDRALR